MRRDKMNSEAQKSKKFMFSSFNCSTMNLSRSFGDETDIGSKGEDDDGRLFGSSDSFLPGLHDDVALTCLARASRSDYASLSCLNVRFNMLIKSGYLYELRRQLRIVEHWVYMVCDPRGWEAFDPFRING
ncbi:hypothetical protein Sango_0475000 [Sesamum angolense]|uniref:Uncharacterized protein n=1 Tax=Sesamum angolense TaxID=2727404 RepID=A0AAE1XBX5_9LAMI|nr:hypothetical protein Sango_0475000 [Sesamum angolense]